MEELIKKIEPVDIRNVRKELTALKSSPRPISQETEAIQILSLIDHTTLDIRDTEKSVRHICTQINNIPNTLGIQRNVAGFCIYPLFVPVVKQHLNSPGVALVSVSGGFPSGQIPMEFKKREAEFAIKNGAQEIDIVIAAGKILEKRYDEVIAEIREIKRLCPPGIVLKVILESGIYQNKEDLQYAAACALAGGADFLKTSTGKLVPAAQPEDVWIMANMVRTFYRSTSRKVGIKAAGGISTPEDALFYINIVRSLLGDAWISPATFRIGASRLTGAVLSLIRKDAGTNYF